MAVDRKKHRIKVKETAEWLAKEVGMGLTASNVSGYRRCALSHPELYSVAEVDSMRDGSREGKLTGKLYINIRPGYKTVKQYRELKDGSWNPEVVTTLRKEIEMALARKDQDARRHAAYDAAAAAIADKKQFGTGWSLHPATCSVDGMTMPAIGFKGTVSVEHADAVIEFLDSLAQR